MTRVLRSAAKKIQNSEDLTSKLSISNRSKAIKKRERKDIKPKNEDNQQSSIWSISSILSNIFAYVDHKDLVEFNTICKKWNNLTNPIIHKTIRLDSRWNDSMRYFYKRINNAAKIDADVVECISNNVKHAHLVKEFKFNFKLRPLRAIEVFETFRFISSLTVEECDMAQGQFLGMINPLTQLQELTLRSLQIKNIFRKNLYKEAVQLPSSLKKLRLVYIGLIDNPQLFIQTMNSHNSLEEFGTNFCTNNKFLEPFYKHYPNLLNIQLDNIELQTFQPLLTVIENNPQLINLRLFLTYWNSGLISSINKHLTLLEVLDLSEYYIYNRAYIDYNFKFSQPTKIKKLVLHLDSLNNCSLNSILTNCPHLEEFDLNPLRKLVEPNLFKFLNLSNPVKLKKLVIECDSLSKGVFDTLLSNCLYLNEMEIRLPCEWKEAIKSIYEKCSNLERLTINPSNQIYNQGIYDAFFRDIYKTELFTSNPKCKYTLTHLTFKHFKIHDSKAEYFKNFDNLKSIKYPKQFKKGSNSTNEEAKIIKDLWPGYKVLLTDFDPRYDIIYDVELKR